MNVSEAIDAVLQAQGASGGKPLAIRPMPLFSEARPRRSMLDHREHAIFVA